MHPSIKGSANGVLSELREATGNRTSADIFSKGTLAQQNKTEENCSQNLLSRDNQHNNSKT